MLQSNRIFSSMKKKIAIFSRIVIKFQLLLLLLYVQHIHIFSNCKHRLLLSFESVILMVVSFCADINRCNFIFSFYFKNVLVNSKAQEEKKMILIVIAIHSDFYFLSDLFFFPQLQSIWFDDVWRCAWVRTDCTRERGYEAVERNAMNLIWNNLNHTGSVWEKCAIGFIQSNWMSAINYISLKLLMAHSMLIGILS